MYCIELHCIALYCIALYSIAMYYIALYCIALYCIALHCIVLHCIVFYCGVLCCAVLHCILLCCRDFLGCWAKCETVSESVSDFLGYRAAALQLKMPRYRLLVFEYILFVTKSEVSDSLNKFEKISVLNSVSKLWLQKLSKELGLKIETQNMLVLDSVSKVETLSHWSLFHNTWPWLAAAAKWFEFYH